MGLFCWRRPGWRCASDCWAACSSRPFCAGAALPITRQPPGPQMASSTVAGPLPPINPLPEATSTSTAQNSAAIMPARAPVNPLTGTRRPAIAHKKAGLCGSSVCSLAMGVAESKGARGRNLQFRGSSLFGLGRRQPAGGGVPPAWLLLRTRYVPRRGVRACMCSALCVVISRVTVLSLMCACRHCGRRCYAESRSRE